jgi:anti-anti-sigma regulatory factor
MRITCSSVPGWKLVQIDGRLEEEGLPELERTLAWLTGPVRLELAGLTSVDGAGLDALRALRARGLSLHGASPYVALLLDPDGPPEGPRRITGRGSAG